MTDITGWTIIKEFDDGSLLIQSKTGWKQHIWQLGDEKLVKRIEELEIEVNQLCDQLREQTKSFCTYCGKLFPKGKEGFAQFREHMER